jgi:hypothetical protein
MKYRMYLCNIGCTLDMVYWLIGANTPIMKNAFKMSKFGQKILGVNLNILCSFTKVLLRKDILCGLCEEEKKISCK